MNEWTNEFLFAPSYRDVSWGCCMSIICMDRPDTADYVLPRTRIWFGKRGFQYSAWNSLPADFHDVTDTNTFKKRLKTVLFDRAYWLVITVVRRSWTVRIAAPYKSRILLYCKTLHFTLKTWQKLYKQVLVTLRALAVQCTAMDWMLARYLWCHQWVVQVLVGTEL